MMMSIASSGSTRPIARIAPIVALLAAACSRPEDERPLVGDHRSPIAVDVYFSVEECARAGRLDKARCASGLRQAMARHDRFSPRWNHPELCESEHGTGACTPAPPTEWGQPYWGPRPVAFLVRFAGEPSSAPILFAPVYRHSTAALYTGQGGGRIEPLRQAGSAPRPERHQVVGVLDLHPPVY